MRRSVLLAILGATLAACGDSDDATGPQVYAAYVLLAPAADNVGTIAVARAIVAPGQASCPTLEPTSGGSEIAMRLRSNPDPEQFPVDVCEGVIPFGESFRVSWNRAQLPVARANPSKLFVLGDTGCEASDCTEGELAEPFATIAAATAKVPAPDLILHVGDYNYRGTPGTVKAKGSDTSLDVYDAGDNAPDDELCQLDTAYVSQNAGYSEVPDNWQDWKIDFFEAAGPLLARAPWVFVRGNHELCSRAGPGWFYFLDAGALAEHGGTGELSCPFQGGDEPPPPPIFGYLQFAPPYTLDLGTLQLAVVDSANACDAFAPAETTDIYADQLAEVLARVRPGATTWMVTHRPFWAATKEIMSSDITPPPYESIDRTLQEALALAVAAGPGVLPDEIRLVLAGHIHAFQSATAYDASGTPRPPQLVIGNSGVALDEHAPTGELDATVDDFTNHITGMEKFGFLDIASLDSSGNWKGAILDDEAKTLVACDSENLPDSLCVLP